MLKVGSGHDQTQAGATRSIIGDFGTAGNRKTWRKQRTELRTDPQRDRWDRIKERRRDQASEEVGGEHRRIVEGDRDDIAVVSKTEVKECKCRSREQSTRRND